MTIVVLGDWTWAIPASPDPQTVINTDEEKQRYIDELKNEVVMYDRELEHLTARRNEVQAKVDEAEALQ